MSDNLFVFNNAGGTVKWASFDVSKMEGSHDRRDLRDIVDLTFKPYKNLTDVER